MPAPIDRRAVVRRHNPVLTSPDATSPLSVGNGELAYTADITGFQTFDGYDPGAPGTVPLCAMTQWGFHSYPGTASRDEEYRRLRRAVFRHGTREVGYTSDPTGQEERFRELRVSPHRADLVRTSLVHARPGTVLAGRAPAPLATADVDGYRQRLDLWEGALDSTFRVRGCPVHSSVVCHPHRDALAFTVETSPGDQAWNPAVSLSFPAPLHAISGADWTPGAAAGHTTTLHRTALPEVVALERVVDDLVYTCWVRLAPGCRIHMTGPHACTIVSDEPRIAFTIELVQGRHLEAASGSVAPDWDACRHEAAAHWQRFWEEGAFLDLGAVRHSRAVELERRVVLSRYLTAIQCSGSLPPQETGLTCNSWYGKFHLEMHPWHALHFALWGQPELLERSLAWYGRIADRARERAQEQGYRGLRWPKMTDPAGYDSPSPIGTLLCWQQPHFIVMVETLYRLASVDGQRSVLVRYGDLVHDTAEFMADYAHYSHLDGRYHLAPPLIPAQENHAPEETVDPVFELEYWRLGLSIAAEWKRREGRPVPDGWERVGRGLADPPVDHATGGYAAHAACEDTYGRFAQDHPSFLVAFSYFAGERMDAQVVVRSLRAVDDAWDFDSAWGWDFPVLAMAAARLGWPQAAVNYLLADAAKNTYRPNGHNAQSPKADLPLYLPGNGALLLAVALMAGGWPGAGGGHPGFPADWDVRSEGFQPAPF